jgi:hypothetical protein
MHDDYPHQDVGLLILNPKSFHRNFVMVFSLLFGLASLFFVLGHSTLLFFRAKEVATISLKGLILPWPKSGKFVSLLSLFVSLCCTGNLIYFAITSRLDSNGVSWRVVFALAIVPIFFYGNYIFCRLRFRENEVIFVCKESNKLEWIVPMLLAPVVSLGYWIFK